MQPYPPGSCAKRTVLAMLVSSGLCCTTWHMPACCPAPASIGWSTQPSNLNETTTSPYTTPDIRLSIYYTVQTPEVLLRAQGAAAYRRLRFLQIHSSELGTGIGIGTIKSSNGSICRSVPETRAELCTLLEGSIDEHRKPS